MIRSNMANEKPGVRGMLAIRRPNASLQVALAPERQRLFEVQGVAKLANNPGLSQSDINSSMCDSPDQGT